MIWGAAGVVVIRWFMAQRKPFPFSDFEPKWQEAWEAAGAWRAKDPGEEGFDPAARKAYILDMFPYPSGNGLHIGHPLQKTACDVVARKLRMDGVNVLFPAGWDSFGLPAEQYAVKTGQHPRVTTEANIANFTRQIKQLGFSYDWSREVATSDPDYYRWTQWIFLKIYDSWFDEGTGKARPLAELPIPEDVRSAGEEAVRDFVDSKRLAYVDEAPVNWSPDLGTVLANEEVEEWTSKGFRVERRPMRQWMLRIRAFAQRLIDDLDLLDWPEALKTMQRNWIGRSEGAVVEFRIADFGLRIEVFTTRPDTLFGATYVVLAPEHPLVDEIVGEEQRGAVAEYRKVVAAKSDLERTDLAKDKSGVPTGAFAVNPVNGERIPIWIADYVLMGYGTGAIMAVPGHDARDFEFATQFGLEVREVVAKERAASPTGESRSGGDGGGDVSSPFYEPREEITKREGGDLPHWQQHGKMIFVTWRLVDALPAAVVEKWRAEAVEWERMNPQPWSDQQKREYAELTDDRRERWLDAGHGECWLKSPEIGGIVAEALRHFDGDRYDLHAFVVMPNHVHVVFTLGDEVDLSATMQGWKSFTAKAIGRALGREGTIWQREYFDRIVRNERHAWRVCEYVRKNAVSAGLVVSDLFFVREGGTPSPRLAAFAGDGFAVNSGFLDGLATVDAKRAMIDWLEAEGCGRGSVNYKLRDWLFSRQRYWGEPFPIVWRDGRHFALPESELPLLPPEMEDFAPAGDGRPPLAKVREWVELPDGGERETNTMPQWAGSCWYYLRFLDPRNADAPVGAELERYWMGESGVDLYVGGVEHAVLHLLYARFWHKVLFDLGIVGTPEPFHRLMNQGLIQGEDGQKMSKSRGNVVNPDAVVEEFGADSLRLFELFMGPLDQPKPWSMKGVEGVHRFLARVWRLVMVEDQEGRWELSPDLAEAELTNAQRRVVHASTKKVTEDVAAFAFNTAISQMMVLTNEFVGASPRPVEGVRTLLRLLSPFAPHLADELWERLGGRFADFEGRASEQSWPTWNEEDLVEDEVEIVVQVNGKVREKMTVRIDASREDIEAAALASERIVESVAGLKVLKVIVVPGKLVNVVAK